MQPRGVGQKLQADCHVDITSPRCLMQLGCRHAVQSTPVVQVLANCSSAYHSDAAS